MCFQTPHPKLRNPKLRIPLTGDIALSGRLKLTVRRHKFDKDSFSIFFWQAMQSHAKMGEEMFGSEAGRGGKKAPLSQGAAKSAVRNGMRPCLFLSSQNPSCLTQLRITSLPPCLIVSLSLSFGSRNPKPQRSKPFIRGRQIGPGPEEAGGSPGPPPPPDPLNP